jgi:hypothetical protein
MSVNERAQLILQLYQNKAGGGGFPDVRRFCTPEKVFQRLKQLVQESRIARPRPGQTATRRFKQMKLEAEMLRVKLSLQAKLSEASAFLGPSVVIAKSDGISLNDSAEEDAKKKEAHTVTLLHFIYARKTNEQLTAMLGRCQ